MFDSTYNFYKSKEWKNLIHVIKLQRMNDEGFIICERCGKPIIKVYDCIGHHKQQLDDFNVNDLNISLNPDNIALVHHSCHNDIHKRFIKPSDRKVYIIYGSPLSGKTSFVNSVRQEGDLIIDMDSIWQCFSGCDRYQKPWQIKSNIFGIRDYVIEQIRYRRGNWCRAYIIGGYPQSIERSRLMDQLSAEAIFIDTSKEECLRRLDNFSDGRDVEKWTKYINDWWKLYEQS